jgi:hypothetical protein
MHDAPGFPNWSDAYANAYPDAVIQGIEAETGNDDVGTSLYILFEFQFETMLVNLDTKSVVREYVWDWWICLDFLHQPWVTSGHSTPMPVPR